MMIGYNGIAFRTVNEAANEAVAFMKLKNLVIEAYENKAAKMESRAVLCIRQNLGPWENFLHEMDNETTMRCRCAIEDQDQQ